MGIQRAANNSVISSCLCSTPAGPVYLSATPAGINRISFLPPPASGSSEDTTVLQQARTEIIEYFSGSRRQFTIQLDLDELRPFQRRVLELAAAIPFGRVRRYGDLAVELGSPQLARAVGGALAANPIAVVIPCHRVIGSDGRLHGYASPSGTQTKALLLQLEGHTITVGKWIEMHTEENKPDHGSR